MLEACRAKFRQNILARDILLATGERPLTHRTRRDSTTFQVRSAIPRSSPAASALAWTGLAPKRSAPGNIWFDP